MSSHDHTVGIAVTCVDYRLHKQSIVPQLEALMDVDSVYVRTTAGPEARILAEAPNPHLESIVADLTLLINAKGAEVVAVVGHCDCAGHPVSDEQHVVDDAAAAKKLQIMLPPHIRVIPLLAHKPENEGEPWRIRPIEA